MKLKIAAVLTVLALAGLAACGPTTAATPGVAPASHAPCADADGSMGDPDGDCKGS